MLFFKGVDYLTKKSSRPKLEIPTLPAYQDPFQFNKFIADLSTILENETWPTEPELAKALETLLDLSERSADSLDAHFYPKLIPILTHAINYAEHLPNIIDIILTSFQSSQQALLLLNVITIQQLEALTLLWSIITSSKDSMLRYNTFKILSLILKAPHEKLSAFLSETPAVRDI